MIAPASTPPPRFPLNLSLAAALFVLLGLALVFTSGASHSGLGGLIVGPPLLAVGVLLIGLVVLRANPPVSKPGRVASYLLLAAAIAFLVFLVLSIAAPTLVAPAH